MTSQVGKQLIYIKKFKKLFSFLKKILTDAKKCDIILKHEKSCDKYCILHLITEYQSFALCCNEPYACKQTTAFVEHTKRIRK